MLVSLKRETQKSCSSAGFGHTDTDLIDRCVVGMGTVRLGPWAGLSCEQEKSDMISWPSRSPKQEGE